VTGNQTSLDQPIENINFNLRTQYSTSPVVLHGVVPSDLVNAIEPDKQYHVWCQSSESNVIWNSAHHQPTLLTDLALNSFEC
jgi:hypothetical protein